MLTAAAVGCSRPLPEAFVDVSRETGLEFVHDNGSIGERYFSEVVGPGAAWTDYDGDGDLDLYLVQGGSLDPAGDPAERPSDVLLRNDVTAGGPRWVDVSARAGIVEHGYGMGIAAGDIDGDGDVDLYVTNFGRNLLWSNAGDGTFVDTTTPTLAEPRWTTSAAFLDYDGDGDLDLFAANYVEYRLAQHRPCLNAAGAIEYCGPASFPPETDRLWRNDGTGGFEDVTGQAGLLGHAGSGLGVVSADFDGNGLPDLYVANDLMPNFLWINQGDGSFREDALLAGCAVNEQGAPEASMGVAVADFDRDGDEDLFMTHLDTETNTAYANDRGLFTDVSNEWGLTVPSLGLTGFGTVALDYDSDGWIDLAAANGAVKTLPDQRAAGDPLPLREPNLLLRNEAGSFVDRTETAPVLLEKDVSRGLAAGDFDNDGDTDLVVLNNGGRAMLLRNEAKDGFDWAGVELIPGAGAPALGAEVRRSGEDLSIATVRSAASYCSAQDTRLRLGGQISGTELTLGRTGRRPLRLSQTPAHRYLRFP